MFMFDHGNLSDLVVFTGDLMEGVYLKSTLFGLL